MDIYNFISNLSGVILGGIITFFTAHLYYKKSRQTIPKWFRPYVSILLKLFPKEDDLKRLINSQKEYWNKIKKVNSEEHASAKGPEFILKINTKLSAKGIVRKARQSIFFLEDMPDEFIADPDIGTKYFEYVCLGMPNHTEHLRVHIEHLYIKYLEECVKNNAQNLKLANELKDQRNRFKKIAQTASLVD